MTVKQLIKSWVIIVGSLFSPLLINGQNTETDFLTFSLSEQTSDATINTTDHSIVLEVVNGTDLTSLSPTFTLSTGATASPESGISQDFSSSFTYSVTAEDGTTVQDWTVTVTEALNTETDFLTFTMDAIDDVTEINTTDHSVTVEVPYGTSLSGDLIPVFTLSEGASTSDLDSGSGKDFTNSVTATVTAEDGTTTQDWTVTVTEAPHTETDFLTFSFSEQTGDATINTTDHTIQIAVANGTDVTSLTPSFTLSNGATASPLSDVALDFSANVTYTVTAQDGVTVQDWVVTVTEAPKLEFLSFSLNGQVYSSTIDTANYTIDVPMPFGTDLSSLHAAFQIPDGVSSSVIEGQDQDYNTPVTITLTFDFDGSTQDWVISAWPEPVDYSKLIAYYPFDGSGNDISGNGYSSYSISNVGGADRFGKSYVLGGGAQFEYGEALDILFQDAYSIAFWIKVNNASDGNILRAPGLTLDYESTAGIIHSTITKSDGTTIAGPTISVTTGEWEHCIFTSNGIEFVTYRNGVQEGSTAPDTEYQYTSGSFIVGDSDANYEIDDMLILNEPVNGTEVENLYQYQLDEFYQRTKPLFYSIDHPVEQQLPNLNINDRTVNLVMSESEDLTNLEVSVRLIDNAIVKLGDVEQEGGVFTDDFSSDVALSFVSEDGFTQQDWTVTVTEATNAETDFLSFSIEGSSQTSNISTGDHTIEMDVEAGSDLSYLLPNFTLSEGASSDPASGVAQDFTSEVVYTVTAEDGMTTQDWAVNISTIPQNYTFTSANPATGTLVNTSGTSFKLSFTDAIPQELLTDVNFGITSRLSGAVQFEFSGAESNTITLTPLNDLLPGDDITITVANSIVTAGESIRYKTVKSVNLDGTRSFSNVQEISLSFFTPELFEIVDMDEDGDLDFLYMSNAQSGELFWAENDGAGTLNFTEHVIPVDESYSADIYHFDYNRDGRPEPVLGRSAGGGGAAIYLYDQADIVWQEFLFPGDGDPVKKVLTDDLNNDLRPDIVTLNEEEKKLVFFQNRDSSTPSFTLETKVIDVGVEDFLLEDLNADGNIDIMTRTTSGSIRAYYNNGETNPTFSSWEVLSSTDGLAFAVGYIGASNYPHLVVSKDNSIKIYNLSFDESISQPIFSEYHTIPESTTAHNLVLADLDLDGDLDIVSQANDVVWHENNTDTEPSFISKLIGQGESTDYTFHVADMDGDSDLDVLTAAGGGGVRYYEAITAELPDADIQTFSFDGIDTKSLINTSIDTVSVVVPFGTDKNELIPEFTLSSGATSNISSGVAGNFSVPVTYQVTSEGGTFSKDWVVIVQEDFINRETLQAYYSFDGNGLDVSGNELNGSFTSENFTMDRFGNENAAFHASEPEIQFTYPSSSDFFSDGSSYIVSFWIKVEEATDGMILSSGSIDLFYESVAGTIQSTINTESGESQSGPIASVSLGKWEHIVFVITSVETFAIRNGQVENQDFPSRDLKDAGGNFLIGGNNVSFAIDDLAIFQGFYNASQIQGMYETQESEDFMTLLPYFTDFNVNNQFGSEVISRVDKTIDLQVTSETGLSLLQPTYTLNFGATGSPESTVFQNFTNPVTYSVTAANQTTIDDWTVTITVSEVFDNNTNILSFDLPNQLMDESIDSENHTIQIIILAGTDLTNLSPTISIPEGASINPASGVEQDFTNDVTYTVTAPDGFTTQDWTVQVSVEEASSETDILSISMIEQIRETFINTVDHFIVIDVISTSDITDLTPIFTLSPGAVANPASGLSQDFTDPVIYEVIAEDGITKQNWTIVASLAGSSETSTSTDIFAFELASESEDAVIDADNHTINATVVQGTDVTNLTPTITLFSGATISPASGVARDFTENVTYLVTAEDGTTTQSWEVSVTVLQGANSATDILSFKLPNQFDEEIIDKTNHTVEIQMPVGLDLSNLTPTSEVSPGATIDPSDSSPQDFSRTQTYMVVAEDQTTFQDWRITTTLETNTAPVAIFLDNTTMLGLTRAGQEVGKIDVVDGNAFDQHSLSLETEGDFAIDQNRLVTARVLSPGNYGATIIAEDVGGLQTRSGFTIEIVALETSNTISIGTSISDYRIVGMPTDQVQVAEVFTNLSAVDQGETWRILDYLSDGTYADLTTTSVLSAGKGYWILSENRVDVQFEQDPVTVDSEGKYMMVLQPGWNLISNPFPEELNWELNVQRNIDEENFIASNVPTNVIIYNGAYSSAASLDVFQGGWVNVVSARDLTVELQNPSAVQSTGSSRPEGINQRDLRLTLSDGNRSSTLSGFSFHERAKSGLDPYDQVYPPAISLDHQFRLEGIDGIDFNAVPFGDAFQGKWHVIAPGTSNLNLSWNSDQVAAFGKEIYFILNDQKVVSMNKVNQLRVNHGDQIEILLGKNDPRVIVQLYPNPAQDFVNMKIASLSDKGFEVLKVEILDLSGKRITEMQFEAQQEIQFSTDLLNDGLYIVRTWIDNNLVAEKKVTIRH